MNNLKHNMSGSSGLNKLSETTDNLPVLSEHSADIYDYSVYKIQYMISELKEQYLEHPDIYALEQILRFYINKEVTITWDGGYPMVDIN